MEPARFYAHTTRHGTRYRHGAPDSGTDLTREAVEWIQRCERVAIYAGAS